MNEEKKNYLSLYRLQNEKIRRLNGEALNNPEEKSRYIPKIKAACLLRDEIEEKIEEVDGGLLSEVLYLKYVCGKTLLQIGCELNYSVRHIERLHIKALERFKL